MKKLALTLAITSALGLTGCDDTTLEDVKTETATESQTVNQTATRVSVVFDPSNSRLSVPNDLLFLGTTDGTLNMPGESDDDGNMLAKDAINWGDPQTAFGALDGWGAQNAFSIALDYEAGVTLDADTVATGVNIFQVIKYPSALGEGCGDATKAGLVCDGVAKLTYGQDFVTQVQGGNIVVVPLKPFQAGASYAVALTKNIKDSNGNSLLPSSTYATVEADISTSPLVSPDIPDGDLNASQRSVKSLQGVINNFETVLEKSFDITREEIVYTQVFTVQAAGVQSVDPIQVAKLLNAQAFTALSDMEKVKVVMPTMVGDRQMTAADFLSAASAISADPTDPTNFLFQSAHISSTTIDLPYYLENADGNPLTGRWEAACDSGVILAGMSDEQKVAAATAAAANPDSNNALCMSLGLADFGVDTQRHLTKYNPVPLEKSKETVNVQVTTPNLTIANMIRASKSMEALEKPENGWPVVIVQHGITRQKEDMLAISGALSVAGYATVAIDHPLHGTRGFTLTSGAEGEEVTKIINTTNGAGGSTTDYFNLANLLTARDNLRQSAADMLQLRLLLNGFIDGEEALGGNKAFDETNVHLLGHSLGAITGSIMAAVANSDVTLPPMNGVDDMTKAGMEAAMEAAYALKTVTLANPGASIGNFLAESPSFGNLIEASVTAGLGNELSAALLAYTEPAAFAGIIAANPTGCGPAVNPETGAVVNQNLALMCAYSAFVADATDAQKAGVKAGVSQFAFAAQAALEAGDPTNYMQLLKASETPTLVFEVVGEGTEDGSKPDQTIPNTVSTDPLKQIGGTTGLASQLGLEQVSATKYDDGNTVSGIVRFTNGTHGSLLSASQSEESLAVAPNALKNAAVNQEMQNMAAAFISQNGQIIPVSASITISVPDVGDVPVTCFVEGAEGCSE